jgi:hypothetical protein
MISLLAVKAPVLGLNLSFVDDTYSGKLPDIAVFQTGYITAFVVVSSVVPVLVAFVTTPDALVYSARTDKLRGRLMLLPKKL